MSAASHRRDVIRRWLEAEPGLSAKDAWERWLDSDAGPSISYTAVTRDFKIIREEWGQVAVTLEDAPGADDSGGPPGYQEVLAELLAGAMAYFRQAQTDGHGSVAREWAKVARGLLSEARLSGEADEARREAADVPVLAMIDEIVGRAGNKNVAAGPNDDDEMEAE